jgi:hypothetical protein
MYYRTTELASVLQPRNTKEKSYIDVNQKESLGNYKVK